MTQIKSKLQNSERDEFLKHSLVIYLEEGFVFGYKVDAIAKLF